MSALRPKEPTGRGWVYCGLNQGLMLWRGKGGVVVYSSLNEMELPDGSGKGPQWLISISRRGKRPRPQDVARALRDFGMQEAEEDNHSPGISRAFFLVCDPAHRVDCECKVNEDVLVEPDGYRWTNPKADSGEACRGCELEVIHRQLGRTTPCPIHSRPA